MAMNDEELAKFLDILDDPRWPQAVGRLTPEKRAAYEKLADATIRIELWQAGLADKPSDILID